MIFFNNMFNFFVCPKLSILTKYLDMSLRFALGGRRVQLLCHVWPCDPMDCSKAGSPVLHHLPEFAQVHVHRVGNAL